MSFQPSWVVVADGGAARFFHRPKAGAALDEQPELMMNARDREKPDRPRQSDAAGSGRRASMHEHFEEQFLVEVAKRVDELMANRKVGRLAICAAPKALGVLRRQLSESSSRRITCEIAKDLIHEPTVAIQERLREYSL